MAKKTVPWAYLALMLAAMVGLATAPLASAQDQGQSAMQNEQNKVTATGCLQQAASGNGYQLTDSASMKTYDLIASGNVDLSAEVGHTVTVTGTATAATAANQEPGQQPGANPAGAAQPNQQLTVEKMKKVSDTCQGGGGL